MRRELKLMLLETLSKKNFKQQWDMLNVMMHAKLLSKLTSLPGQEKRSRLARPLQMLLNAEKPMPFTKRWLKLE